MSNLNSIHPGEILQDVLDDLDISQAAIGGTAEHWIRLQAAYDLHQANLELKKKGTKIKKMKEAA